MTTPEKRLKGVSDLTAHDFWEDLVAAREDVANTPDFTEHCTEYFYEGLFAKFPGVEELFSNPEQQRTMFSLMLAVILRSCKSADALDEMLRELGVKHLGFGIQPMHFMQARGIFETAVRRAAPDMSRTYVSAIMKTFSLIESAMLGGLKKA